MVVDIIRADITEEEREKIIKEFKKILANMVKDINSQQQQQQAVHIKETSQI